MKKRVMALTMAAMMAVTATGCSSGGAKGTDTGSKAEEKEAAAPAEEKGKEEEGKAEEGESTWPQGETLTIVVPFKAGGSADLMVRGILPYWEETAGCTFVVENREGASTMVGSVYYQTLPADGTNIYCGTQTYLSGNQVLQGATYDISDFDLINMQQIDPTTITVLDTSPYNTIEDLVKAIQDNPGKIKVGLTAGGAGSILLGILTEAFNLDYKTIYYDSGNDFRTALMGGHVDFITGSANGDLGLGDQAKVLAVCGSDRNAIWPDTPSFDEVYPDLKIPGSLGSCRLFAVQKGVKENYPDRYQTLVDTYKEAFENPEYQKFLESSGELAVSAFRGPEESNKLNLQLHELVVQYQDWLKEE